MAARSMHRRSVAVVSAPRYKSGAAIPRANKMRVPSRSQMLAERGTLVRLISRSAAKGTSIDASCGQPDTLRVRRALLVRTLVRYALSCRNSETNCLSGHSSIVSYRVVVRVRSCTRAASAWQMSPSGAVSSPIVGHPRCSCRTRVATRCSPNANSTPASTLIRLSSFRCRGGISRPSPRRPLPPASLTITECALARASSCRRCRCCEAASAACSGM